MKKTDVIGPNYGNLLEKITGIFSKARMTAIRAINVTQVMAYFEIGREIVEFEQHGKIRAEYGEELILNLSRDMTNRFGRGFSERNLRNMRSFYTAFSIRQTLSAESGKRESLSEPFIPNLPWSHYCELLKVEDTLARSFYENEAAQNNWSVRELKRQINSMLFERLALSRNTTAVMKLAKKGQIIETPEDAIKDPYVLEFLNLREESAYTESQLEQALIDKLQDFLLELGKGFSFVARQKRITIANRHYHIDLVFYNRFLKCFVLIDLKTGEFDHADAGQMNFYLNYFKENETMADENDPIGLILCARKDDIFARYVLGGLSNKVFASKYKLALPSERQLKQKLKSLPDLLDTT
ncbi:MAG: PDDEXK nuclease domain-containing protein [Deltaproteobacteria bacterium]|nr:PDDEXK nuclease domain-containing protein [Deltaproteobacteria bacterium]